MRAVLQRVTRARVTIDGRLESEIGLGLVVLLGISRDDSETDIDYLIEKTAAIRIFHDADGRMNLSIKDVGGELMIVSQFTLYGDVRRGRRPSWIAAAPPELAEHLYNQFIEKARMRLGRVATGAFRQMMQVELVNDGPVTILIDSRESS